jgi:hypothetical protein
MRFYLEFNAPADGTSAASVRNGDFSMLPIFEQLSGKPPLASLTLCGVLELKNKAGQ